MAFSVERSPLLQEYLRLLQESNSNKKIEAADHKPLSKDDALLIVDVQCDYVAKDDLLNPHGGRVEIPEGQWIVGPVVAMIQKAAKVGATVVAIKDYHPVNHVSFTSKGGSYPTHCVQGTKGADLLAPVAAALAMGRQQGSQPDSIHVAFKGYHEDVDSLAALPYKEGPVFDSAGIERRLDRRAPGKDQSAAKLGCPGAPWTGAVLLKQSELANKTQNKKCDAKAINAPPDLLAMYEEGAERRERRGVEEVLKGKKRLFVCGLGLDFGVLDTCVNARSLGFEAVYVVLDASRATHGQGAFRTKPEEVLNTLRAAGVHIAGASSVAGLRPRALIEVAPEWDFQWRLEQKPPRWRKLRVQLNDAVNDSVFPTRLGKFVGLVDVNVKDLFVQMKDSNTYTPSLVGDLKLLSGFGFEMEGRCTPAVALPAGWVGAEGAVSVRWAGPLKGLEALYARSSTKRLCTMLKVSTAPELCFALWGGFLLLDAEGRVLKVQLLSPSKPGESRRPTPSDSLSFLESQKVPGAAVRGMHDRLQDVVWPHLIKRKAAKFCWVGAGEVFGEDNWSAPASGGLVFTLTGSQFSGNGDSVPVVEASEAVVFPFSN